MDSEKRKRNTGVCRMTVWVFKEKESRTKGQKVKRWMERAQDQGIRMNGGKGGVLNNGWPVLKP